MQSLQIYGNYIAIEIKSIPSNFTSSRGLSILLQLYANQSFLLLLDIEAYESSFLVEDGIVSIALIKSILLKF